MAIYLARMLRKGGLLAISAKFRLRGYSSLYQQCCGVNEKTPSERSSTARAM
jgi:hypothetical protein